MNEPEGWIRLYRKIRQHRFWPKRRPYSMLEAWLDLLLSANHKADSLLLGFWTIHIARGQHLTSQIKLAKRWRWNRKTVSKFLQLLKSDGMIDIKTRKLRAVIRLSRF